MKAFFQYYHIFYYLLSLWRILNKLIDDLVIRVKSDVTVSEKKFSKYFQICPLH